MTTLAHETARFGHPFRITERAESSDRKTMHLLSHVVASVANRKPHEVGRHSGALAAVLPQVKI
jgi:hypothetical protein